MRITRSCFSRPSSTWVPASQRFHAAVLSRSGPAGARTGICTVTVSVLPAASFTPTVSTDGSAGAVAGAVPVTVPSAATDSHASPAIFRKTGAPEERIHRPPSLTLTAAPGATWVAVRASTAACGRGTTGLGRKLNGAVCARIPYPSLASRYAVYGPPVSAEVSSWTSPDPPGVYFHSSEEPVPGCRVPS